MNMKKLYLPFVLIIFCLVITAGRAMAETYDSDWELVMNKNGIKAYSRKVSGSGIFEFRAVMVVDARAEVVAEALRDIPAMPQWLPDCDKAALINMEGRNNFTTYISLDLPWPVKDRDAVMKTVTTYDFAHARAVTDFVTFQEASYPPNDSHVRIPDIKGQYVFEFVTREKTGIVQTYRADIGGNIPEWMTNFATKYNIYNTFMNLKEMFKKEKYLESAKTSPDREICENFQTDRQQAKDVLVARLREFIRDADFVDMIQNSPAIDEVLNTGNGRISETLLYGWGSDESKKKAIHYILKIYLAGRTGNEATAKTVLEDDCLINAILHGSQTAGKSARCIIEGYLKSGSDMAGMTDTDNSKRN